MEVMKTLKMDEIIEDSAGMNRGVQMGNSA